MKKANVRVTGAGWSPSAAARAAEEPYFVMDVGEVAARLRRWRALLPSVEPYYAVKCNDDKLLLRTLAALGTGFDCASKAEIELVTGLGVTPDRIIFANPTKMLSHLHHAAAAGVSLTTFDSEEELRKTHRHVPHSQLLLRFRCDAAAAQCPLGNKFGCDPAAEAPRLLELAAGLRMHVVGVAFHVGSGAAEAGAYARGVRLGAALCARGARLGLAMHTLDLGGGFPGDSQTDIREVADVINAALAAHCPDMRVIAEPGRYFAAAAYTLAVQVYAKRELPPRNAQEAHTMYFLNDGVYGSFKDCVLYGLRPEPQLLHASSERPRPCSLWGPTCDGLDCVLGAARLPPLAVGSCLLFRDMGAYTIACSSKFNGFPLPQVRAFVGKELWLELKDTQLFADVHFDCEEILAEAPLSTQDTLYSKPKHLMSITEQKDKYTGWKRTRAVSENIVSYYK